MTGSSSLLLGRQVVTGRPNLAPPSVILDSLDEILVSHRLTNNGPFVQRLESLIGDDLGAECILTSSGTTSLELMLRTLDPGEVIVPSFTFVATVHAVVAAGHDVVFADIDPRSHCLSLESVGRSINPRTTAILPVHLWGNPASPREFVALAAEAGVTLMFDAAHAYGTDHEGVSIGRFGAAAAFSFHATKAFSAVEGGCVATTDNDLAQRLRAMRTFGMDSAGNVESWGSNYRMSEVHAAVGLANHSTIPGLAARNRANLAAYQSRIKPSGIGRMIPNSPGNRMAPYAVLELDERHASKRRGIIDSLAALGVVAKEYFATPVHEMPPYANAKPHLPVTEHVSRLTMTLPTGMQISPVECETIADELVGLVLKGDCAQISSDDASR